PVDGGNETCGVDGSAGGNSPNGNGPARRAPGSLREQAASPTVAAAATMTARRLTARPLVPSAIAPVSSCSGTGWSCEIGKSAATRPLDRPDPSVASRALLGQE